ncbi:3-alpha-(or 20-beta)-hydroxysteroid dehydrogenase [Novosphingobium sediminis]|uniref:3-alpha-(Or 20-beta)-hydroxysteroid dehydrogenase n=1 Tax=Novosphingobium sediminis TaxID=707214 RepID=A0A512AG73_9SPHN|nr:glucose 1-dehydrogenase [Novosphingobium sediminis]GEN98705.1 3-alpha-(or 20-beta)-hydroxysteroid dehydrogenase [Novosphingobium sediminis]
MSGRLEGKVALISGGASGLGEAQAVLYAREGAKVLIGDLQEALGAAVVAKITDACGEAAFTRLDVTDLGSWQAAVALTVATFGKLTTLVNNAGIFHPGGIQAETPQGWDRMVAVNQTGVFYGMKAGAPELAKAGKGAAIVNISSLYGLIGSPDAISYHASKAAVRVMGKGAALEFVKQGVRVNTIFPGQIRTPILGDITPEQDAAIKASIPMGEVGDPMDIAHASLFLASDEARYITGAELWVDGGWYAGC